MNKVFSNKIRLDNGGARLFFLYVILVFYSHPAKALNTNDPSFTVDNFNLISKKRVSRTDFKYSYTVDLTNFGSVATNVTAKVTSNSTSTSILEGALNFGDILSDTNSTSTDTFTIRQNRRVPFDQNSLVFNINATVHHGLPPNPGEEGKLTIEGIDSDNDGVRDDVQIAITIKYPSNNDETKSALTQLAKALQKGFIKQSNDNPQLLDDVFCSHY